MKACDVCGEKPVELVPRADTLAVGFLLVCSECSFWYQEEHFEDLFKSPVDFQLLLADRRALCPVA